MLDTNICIYVLKNRSDKLRHKFKANKDLCISSVTYGELCFGIENGRNDLQKERWKQLDTFTQRLRIEPLDENAGKHYGTIRAQQKKKVWRLEIITFSLLLMREAWVLCWLPIMSVNLIEPLTLMSKTGLRSSVLTGFNIEIEVGIILTDLLLYI